MVDTKTHVLLVEDEAPLRLAIAEQLTDHGFDVAQAESGEQAVAALAEFAFDLVLTDLRLPGIGGAGVLDAAVERYPEIVVIVMTGFGTVKDAVEAIKRGAADFITKPFQFDELQYVIATALEQRRLRTENAYLRSQLEARYRFEGLIGTSPVMRELFQVLEIVAGTPSTILITGGTGTGKELVARAIHHNSPRRDQRFVAINCGALPESLLEAELFGHVRGAFTGAVGNRQGRLEQAHKGTLFLDEVGTMSTPLQTKLLRVLQEREFERIGENRTTRIDVRVIAATNSDLGRMVRDGTFREDLYYRLNVIPIILPPLRDRPDDIPILVDHFLRDIATSKGTPPRRISPEVMRRFQSYRWQGNVRELRNVLEQMMVLAEGEVLTERDLPDQVAESAQIAPNPSEIPTGLTMDELEKLAITKALDQCGGNRTHAANRLGISVRTLQRKLQQYKLEKPAKPFPNDVLAET
jgi:DNA-binding NtrC family response regulator